MRLFILLAAVFAVVCVHAIEEENGKSNSMEKSFFLSPPSTNYMVSAFPYFISCVISKAKHLHVLQIPKTYRVNLKK